MMRRWAWLLPVAAGCASGPTGPATEATCIAYLQLDGVGYSIVDGAGLSESPTEVVAHVLRQLPCNDQPEPGAAPEPFFDGASNFLPAGTPIYAVPGHQPTDRLAVRPLDVWIVLGPLP